jgi:hypothetical protein
LIVVALTTVTAVAAAPPIVTVAPAAKFVPVIATEVPPLVGPAFGEIALTVGAAPEGGGGAPPLDFGRIVVSFFNAPGELVRNRFDDRTI